MTDTYIYFMRPVGHSGPIKIGVSWMPEHRLMQLTAWSPFPLEIVGTFRGDQVLERQIHNCFAHAHSHCEWFNAVPELVSAMTAMLAGVPAHEAIDLASPTGNVLGLTQRQTKAKNAKSRAVAL